MEQKTAKEDYICAITCHQKPLENKFNSFVLVGACRRVPCMSRVAHAAATWLTATYSCRVSQAGTNHVQDPEPDTGKVCDVLGRGRSVQVGKTSGLKPGWSSGSGLIQLHRTDNPMDAKSVTHTYYATCLATPTDWPTCHDLKSAKSSLRCNCDVNKTWHSVTSADTSSTMAS